MMRSMFSGVAGLRNHQTAMDVIGANISNVNTVGYKGGRSNFSDVISQTMQGAASATGTRGGTNPIQIGLGMGLAAVVGYFGVPQALEGIAQFAFFILLVVFIVLMISHLAEDR